jgi:hypothetical protein
MSATEPSYCPVSTLLRKLRQELEARGGPARLSPAGRAPSQGSISTRSKRNSSSTHPPRTSVVRGWTTSLTPPRSTQRARRATGSHRARAADRACADLSARAERAAGLRSHRRRHRAPRSGTRPPDSHDYPQGRQGRHHPARAAHRPGDQPGHRRAHRRTGVPGRGRRGGWTRTPLTSSPPTSEAPPSNRSTSWKSSARRSQPSDGAACGHRSRTPGGHAPRSQRERQRRYALSLVSSAMARCHPISIILLRPPGGSGS